MIHEQKDDGQIKATIFTLWFISLSPSDAVTCRQFLSLGSFFFWFSVSLKKSAKHESRELTSWFDIVSFLHRSFMWSFLWITSLLLLDIHKLQQSSGHSWWKDEKLDRWWSELSFLWLKSNEKKTHILLQRILWVSRQKESS